MIKDRARVCPKCGSKDISKRCPATDGYENKTFIQFRGRCWCRNCKKVLYAKHLLPFYLFKKKNYVKM